MKSCFTGGRAPYWNHGTELYFLVSVRFASCRARFEMPLISSQSWFSLALGTLHVAKSFRKNLFEKTVKQVRVFFLLNLQRTVEQSAVVSFVGLEVRVEGCLLSLLCLPLKTAVSFFSYLLISNESPCSSTQGLTTVVTRCLLRSNGSDWMTRTKQLSPRPASTAIFLFHSRLDMKSNSLSPLDFGCRVARIKSIPKGHILKHVACFR